MAKLIQKLEYCRPKTDLRPLSRTKPYFENITGNELFSALKLHCSPIKFIDIPVLVGACSLVILSIDVFVETRLNFTLISKSFMYFNVCLNNIDTS